MDGRGKIGELIMEKQEAIKTAYNECIKVCNDEFLISKLNTCLDFLKKDIKINEARKKAFECHKYARELKDKKQILLARACGHAIATIHVKEHLKPC
ncbi:MAG: hypothetical protein LBC75_12710, partial [Fibromonadaceae bacterium]|nr:hypothetical protein [Fibromonadaceae bacterium]